MAPLWTVQCEVIPALLSNTATNPMTLGVFHQCFLKLFWKQNFSAPPEAGQGEARVTNFTQTTQGCCAPRQIQGSPHAGLSREDCKERENIPCFPRDVFRIWVRAGLPFELECVIKKSREILVSELGQTPCCSKSACIALLHAYNCVDSHTMMDSLLAGLCMSAILLCLHS